MGRVRRRARRSRALGCGAEEPRQRPAARAADPGQRRDQPRRDHGAAAADRRRPRKDPADPAEPEPAAAADPAPTTPLDVVFVTANLTATDSKLEIRGPKDASSGPLVANGNGTFQTALPTGPTRSAPPTSPAPSRPLVVGPYRASSQNDVLLP